MVVSFQDWLLAKFKSTPYIRNAYESDAGLEAHFSSGGISVSFADVIKYQAEYEEAMPKLPSQFQYNEVAKVKFSTLGEGFLYATIRGIHFYNNKVKYDLGLWLGDGSVDNPEAETRIYNVESDFLSPSK